MKEVVKDQTADYRYGSVSEAQGNSELLRAVLLMQQQITSLHQAVQALARLQRLDGQKLDSLLDMVDTLIRNLDVYRHG